MLERPNQIEDVFFHQSINPSKPSRQKKVWDHGISDLVKIWK
jgi:hypothetical protein